MGNVGSCESCLVKALVSISGQAPASKEDRDDLSSSLDTPLDQSPSFDKSSADIVLRLPAKGPSRSASGQNKDPGAPVLRTSAPAGESPEQQRGRPASRASFDDRTERSEGGTSRSPSPYRSPSLASASMNDDEDGDGGDLDLEHVPSASVGTYANLTHHEVEELVERFKNMDSNGDGRLSKLEFIAHFGNQQLGSILFEAFDADQSGDVDVNEFISGLAVLSKGSLEERLEFAFTMFDVDRDGEVSKSEILNMLTSVTSILSVLDPRKRTDIKNIKVIADKLFAILDTDGNGFVSKHEFAHGLANNMEAAQLLTLAPANMVAQGASNSLKAHGAKLPVSWGHPQWALVLSMMLGIRTAGEKEAELRREWRDGQPPPPVTLGRAALSRRIRLKINKNPMLQSASDYSFVGYAPEVFTAMRALLGVDEATYQTSMGPSQIFARLLLGDLASLTAHVSAGKSGSLFFHSPDGRFLAKTIPRREKESLMQFLPSLYEYAHTYRNESLLMQILGLYKINNFFFVVVNNVLNTPNEIGRLWDLKGSSAGRTSQPSDYLQKDNNLTEPFDLGNQSQRAYDMLVRDTDLLGKHGLMDYSLLVGVHNIVPGQSVVRETDFVSSDGKTAYYIGVIDYLTYYDFRKGIETFAKGLFTDKKTLSAVEPGFYARRFQEFMASKFYPYPKEREFTLQRPSSGRSSPAPGRLSPAPSAMTRASSGNVLAVPHSPSLGPRGSRGPSPSVSPSRLRETR
eukprot:tig00000147_g9489.t1